MVPHPVRRDHWIVSDGDTVTRGYVDDLMLPIGYVPPRSMQRELAPSGASVGAQADGMKAAGSLIDALGRGPRFKPMEPILLIGPDGSTPILLITEGDVEAAELQDMAMEAIGNQEERVKEHGRGLDFDKLREKHGFVRREDAPMAIKDALAARIAHHKQNPVTDPFRQPHYAPRPPQFALGSWEKEGPAS